VASAEKILQRMRNNPSDWRIEDLKAVADRYCIAYAQSASSHLTFRHAAAGRVTVPVRIPVKPV
jgi:hypothetical protein